jgi:hypothetical protein
MAAPSEYSDCSQNNEQTGFGQVNLLLNHCQYTSLLSEKSPAVFLILESRHVMIINPEGQVLHDSRSPGFALDQLLSEA